MNQRMLISVFDPDIARRAQVSYQLAEAGLYAVPLGSVDELSRDCDDSSVMLVCDEDDAVLRFAHLTSSAGFATPIVAYAQNPTPNQIVRAIQAGAIDFLAWPSEPQLLAASLQEALANGRKSIALKLRATAANSRLNRLTNRERDVLKAMTEGLSNRLIGEKLQISPRTVETHRTNMLNKLGAGHTSQAIRLAVEASFDR
jgi:FixJ family two-component response regulator